MPQPDSAALHTTAVEAARRAGAELARLFRQPRQTRDKGPRDIVTDADMAAERAAIATIRERFPDHAILSEEGGGEANAGALQWIMDPLDGTTNYARGLPYFCVAIAVAEPTGRPLVGVVYDPLRDALYHAQRGGGAFCNERRLAVSQRQRLLDLLALFDWPRAEGPRARIVRMAGALSPAVGSLRNMGSAALALCGVAEGAGDAYFHLTLNAWDMAAAGLIIEAAGGRVTSIAGAADWWSGETCLATNGLIHDELLARLGAAGADPA